MSTYGDTIEFTATVSTTGSGPTPTGTVDFSIAGVTDPTFPAITSLGVPLTDGVATFTTDQAQADSMVVGDYTATATYNPDHLGSFGDIDPYTVVAAATVTVLAADPPSDRFTSVHPTVSGSHPPALHTVD